MSFSEEQLRRMGEMRDPASVPQLVAVVVQQQHDLDNLRLSSDVARRDREELRHALIHAREAEREAREQIRRVAAAIRELRAPVTAIQFGVDLLDDAVDGGGHLDDDQARAMIRAAADRLAERLDRFPRG